MKRCYSCQKNLEMKTPPEAGDLCPHCASPLRCCFNCRQYSPEASQQCLASPTPAPPKNKRVGHSCGGFAFREFFAQRKDTGQEAGRRKWDDLFNL